MAGIGGEAYAQRPGRSCLLAQQLTDIPFAALRHLRGAGVAQVRVVRPYHDPAGAAAGTQVPAQREHRVRHVAVAQIPGQHAAAEQGAVVALGVEDEACVAFGVESFVRRVRSVGGGPGLAGEFHQQRRGGLPAGRAKSRGRFRTVFLRIAHVVHARIQAPCACRLFGIDGIQVGHNRVRGAIEAVQVHAIDADAGRVGPSRIALAQPADELAHLPVAPHPGREAPEVGKRLVQRIVAAPTGVAVQAQHVGPVAFHDHRIEAGLLHETPGDGRAHGVELVGAMCGLAEQHVVAALGHPQQCIVVAGFFGELLSSGAKDLKRSRHGGANVHAKRLLLTRLRQASRARRRRC